MLQRLQVTKKNVFPGDKLGIATDVDHVNPNLTTIIATWKLTLLSQGIVSAKEMCVQILLIATMLL